MIQSLESSSKAGPPGGTARGSCCGLGTGIFLGIPGETGGGESGEELEVGETADVDVR